MENQGSNQADFMNCSECSDLVLVGYHYRDGYKGAVNAALLDDKGVFKDSVSVSPKLLSSSEKLQRWKTVWSQVSFVSKIL